MPNCHHHWRRLLPFEIRTPFAAAHERRIKAHTVERCKKCCKEVKMRSDHNITTKLRTVFENRLRFLCLLILGTCKGEKPHKQKEKIYFPAFNQINIEIPSFVPIFKAMY